MRRAIIFFILLAVMSCIAFDVFLLYYTHSEPSELIDLTSTARKLDSKGNFTGKFKPSSETLKIKNFEYFVLEDDLYITVYVAGVGSSLETDENGYITIEISGLPEIDKIYYFDGEDKSVLSADRE